MKLRTDKQGKPLIVLEAGDIAALERVRGMLVCADIHVGPSDRLRLLANEVRDVVMGKVAGISLPGTRAAKKEPGTVSDAPDGTEPPTDSVPFAVPGHCDKCGEPLVGSELRRGRKTCFECQPLSEQSA